MLAVRGGRAWTPGWAPGLLAGRGAARWCGQFRALAAQAAAGARVALVVDRAGRPPARPGGAGQRPP
ncbi:MAG TPA: hypothetical protein VFW96_22125, partial [Thermomicrobiales bacterium]|nr:hypothetical protein [Thermomicrobiales bacterium]